MTPPPRRWARSATARPHVGAAPPPRPPMTKAASAGPIELHAALVTRRAASVLPAAAARSAARRALVRGRPARALSPTAPGAAQRARTHRSRTSDTPWLALPLRQLLTLAHLQRAHGAAIDGRRSEGGWTPTGSPGRCGTTSGSRTGWPGWPCPRAVGAPPARASTRACAGELRAGLARSLHRNLLDAFDRTYLDALYGHGNRPVGLACSVGRRRGPLSRRGRAAGRHEASLAGPDRSA